MDGTKMPFRHGLIPVKRLVLLLAFWLGVAPVASAVVRIGDPAPDFSLRPLGDAPPAVVTLDALRGHHVILEFWATWCGPSAQSREKMILLHKRHSKQGLRILAVTDEKPEIVERFLEEHPVPYEVFTDESRTIQAAYSIQNIPQALLIDRDGIVRWIGDLRYLPNSQFDRYMATGESPRGYASSTTQPAVEDSEPVLLINISRSHREAPHCATQIEPGDRAFGFKCKALPIRKILEMLLEVSRPRLIASPGVQHHLYDVEYYHEPLHGRPPDRGLLVDSLCREAGSHLERSVEMREVWVARIGEGSPSVGAGKRLSNEVSVSADGSRILYKGTTMPVFLRGLESSYFVMIEDETRLSGRFDLSYDSEAGFDQSRADLEAQAGITMKKEDRDVSVYRLSPMDTE